MSERDEFESAMGWKLKDSQGKHAFSRAHDSQQTYTFLATYWAYEAWQAARATQAGVRDGWKLVPTEPSTGMLAEICNLAQRPSKRYEAMLAAAPQPSPEPKAGTPPIARAFERAVYEAGGFPPGAYRTYQD